MGGKTPGNRFHISRYDPKLPLTIYHQCQERDRLDRKSISLTLVAQ
jgi:hypothetical protein